MSKEIEANINLCNPSVEEESTAIYTLLNLLKENGYLKKARTMLKEQTPAQTQSHR